jgi:hypothetical protein
MWRELVLPHAVQMTNRRLDSPNRKCAGRVDNPRLLGVPRWLSHPFPPDPH